MSEAPTPPPVTGRDHDAYVKMVEAVLRAMEEHEKHEDRRCGRRIRDLTRESMELRHELQVRARQPNLSLALAVLGWAAAAALVIERLT